MKARFNDPIRNLLLLLVLCVALPAAAQENDGIFTVSGTVRELHTRQAIANVSVSVPETRIGTVTNADGTFSIKLKRGSGAGELQFSHLGYRTARMPVDEKDMNDVAIYLAAGDILLANVVVTNLDARLLVDEAIRRIAGNYSNHKNLLTGFYRETIRKRNNYIDIAEAVVEVYHTPYTDGVDGDRLRIVKGRQLVSQRKRDTLAVKFVGGPNAYSSCDIVKNSDILLDPDFLYLYKFRLDGETLAVIDDKPHYVVLFEPHPDIVYPYVFYTGKLYIDPDSYTISRAEYSFDMSDRNKVTRSILRKKPASLRFDPEEVSHTLNYQKRNGRSYLYYINTRIRFRCDWRRKLFATNYTIVSEMVITDGEDEGVIRIPFRESFHSDQSLSDRVSDFYDPDFWGVYNIIEPTESLESAVERLKRRAQ